MKDHEVVEALGGYRAVACALDLKPEIVLHFTKRAIPWRYRHRVKALAKRKRVALPADFLENQRRP